MKTIRIEKEVEVAGKYDVIVAGGGVAGVAAAVSAARMGKKVLLIEKTISLGGLATIGLVNLFVPSCNGRGTKIIKGMAEEMLNLSIRYGYNCVPQEWKDGNEPGESATTRYITRFSINLYILQLTKWLKDEGVEILFDTVVSQPVMEGGHCSALIVENKTGTQCFEADIVIDATGDADVLYRAGVPTVQGKNYHTFYASVTDLKSCQDAVDKQDIQMIYQKRIFGGGANLFGGGHPEGKPFWYGTTAEDVTNYVVENHLEMLEKVTEDVPESRDITELPTMVQLRTTRRIDGDYTLTPADVYKHFEDSVSAMNDFEHRHFLYEIPYRVMIKSGFDNLIAAGRITSGDGYGWDLLRVIPPAIITGQAAGVAAAIAIDEKRAVYDMNIPKLQKLLTEQNVMIHFDDSLVNRELGPDADADFEKYDHI
ncbi:MAG: FAD-dependent oxidoreductase [Ruminococcaceae bacterium]|nr:FAD-dependent oxidoreductase [Oscillospiraceae bacterium]